MAQKTKKTGPKKKTASRTRAKATKSASKAPKSRPAERSMSPLYVLVIMGLATAILLMVNKYGFRQGERNGPPPRDHSPAGHDARTDGPEMEKKHDDAAAMPGEPEKTGMPDRKKDAEKIGKPAKSDAVPAKKQAVKPETKDVKIYLVRLNEESEKMYLAPVARKVAGESVLENTMRELIKGPTASEKKRGMLTAVPSGLRVNRVKIRNNVAEIDFNGAIEQGAAGSILINRIDQIVYTATQFPNVGSVVIKINGKPRQTLGDDGLSIGGPLHRRK